MSTNRGMYKQNVVYKYTMEYYSAIKKEIMTFTATWMNLEIVILGAGSQKEKDRYHTISFICRNLKHNTNEPIYRTETDSQTRENRLWLPGSRGWGVGGSSCCRKRGL